MDASRSAVRTGVAALLQQGKISEALAQVRRLPAPSLEDRVVQCELEALSSNREVALEIASDVAAKSNDPSALVRVLVVAGRICFFAGEIAEGQRRYARARDIASRNQDSGLVALAVGRHVEAVLRYLGLDAVAGDLGHYRKVAIRAGSRLSLSALHRVLAEAELKSGHGHRALKELELALLHLDPSEDLLATAHLHLARSTTEGLIGDIRCALDHANTAAELSARSGALALLRSAYQNVAHLQVLRGLHDEAERTLTILHSTRSTSVDAELEARSSQLMLAGARHDATAIARMDLEFGQTAETRSSNAAQEYRLAKARSLVSVGRLDEAAALSARSQC